MRASLKARSEDEGGEVERKGGEGEGLYDEYGNESRRMTTTPSVKGGVRGWGGGCLQWDRHTHSLVHGDTRLKAQRERRKE